MIKIKNEQLANYIMFKLDKQVNEFTVDELQNIDEIVLNTIDINEEYTEINLDVINYFTGVKRLVLKNLYLSEADIFNLSKLNLLEDVYMEKCEFENADNIASLKIKHLELINCDIINYNFLYTMSELNSLSVVNGNISLNKINNLQQLRYLQLSYSNITEITLLKTILLEEIHIDNTNISDLTVIENLNNIKRLGISEEQYIKNEEFVKRLMDKNIIVMNENIVSFGQGGNVDE